MSNETVKCSAMFCPLLELCKRKDFLGKPYNDSLQMQDFSKSLKYDKTKDDWCCEDGIQVECK